MGTSNYTVRYSNSKGYVALYSSPCYSSWLSLPAEDLWPDWIRTLLYTFVILYLFIGIAIAADIFMLSIEMITSKKRIIVAFDYEKKESVEREVCVWNETVANLTLMALGSSAPEILIAVIETLSSLGQTNQQSLGTFTIIGSASYNLLVISAVCIVSVPTNTIKRIADFGVFVVTSLWSMFAYLWLLIVLKWSSPDQVDIWEAVLTLAFFPLLVLTAWGQDKGWWLERLCKRRPRNAQRRPMSSQVRHNRAFSSQSHIIGVQPVTNHSGSFSFDVDVYASYTSTKSPEVSHRKIRDIVTYVKDRDPNKSPTAKGVIEGIKKAVDSPANKSLARARFRHAAVSALTGSRRGSLPVPEENDTTMLVTEALKKNKSQSPTSVCSSKDGLLYIESEDACEDVWIKKSVFTSDNSLGEFAFSTSTYSVERSSRELRVDVLFYSKRSRSKRVGFSHIVEAATRNLNSKDSDTPPYSRPPLTGKSDTSMDSALSQRTLVSVIDEEKEPDQFINEFLADDDIMTSDSALGGSRCSQETIQGKLLVNGTKSWSLNSHSNDRELNDIFRSDNYTGHTRTLIGNNTKRHSTSSANISFSDILKRESTKASLMELSTAVTVQFETRDGSAKVDQDYAYREETIIFLEHEYKKEIVIPIMDDGSNNNEPEKDFYIILKSPCESTAFGDPNVARVTIINDHQPGELMFQEASYHVDYSTGTVSANVVRIHGCDGNISVQYKTINGTALGGEKIDLENGSCDFMHLQDQTLEFGKGETCRQITIRVNPDSQRGKTFIVVLYNASPGAKLGHRSAAIVSLTSDVDEIVDQVANMITQETKEKTLSQQWSRQFLEAMSLDVGDGKDESLPEMTDYILHFVSFFWKVLFSFIPPRSLLGGWAAFGVSLMMLGILSAFVEQFAKLLGCTINLHNSVTGITLVALGTSMPDTFASRTAAKQDDTADAAIGNINGSNSVNVFLGLGLPWVITSVYLYVNKNGQILEMKDDNLLFTVLVFVCCGMTCLIILMLRRVFLHGELGGGPVWKYGNGLVMFLLWVLFVVICSLRAYGLIPGIS